MTDEPAYPRRSLLGVLRDLLTGPRPTPPGPAEPAAPAQQPGTDDFGDDPTGLWASPGPSPWFSPADPDVEDDGSGDDWDAVESECALDGAPYYGTGVYGRYCSWGCAAADGAGPDEDDATT